MSDPVPPQQRQRRFIVAMPPPKRTPAEMLEILATQVGRDVERIRVLGKEGADGLDADGQELLDTTLERVLKLSRAQRSADGDAETNELRKRIEALKEKP